MSDIVRVKRLRTWLGWLAIALPWIVVLLQLFNETFIWPKSISATWYTNACTPFMIILGASAILLMNYHGYDLIDDILNTAAGIFALGICLFPCYSALFEKVGTTLHNLYGPTECTVDVSYYDCHKDLDINSISGRTDIGMPNERNNSYFGGVGTSKQFITDPYGNKKFNEPRRRK